eukprot:s664_g20.t2
MGEAEEKGFGAMQLHSVVGLVWPMEEALVLLLACETHQALLIQWIPRCLRPRLDSHGPSETRWETDMPKCLLPFLRMSSMSLGKNGLLVRGNSKYLLLRHNGKNAG